MLLLRNVTTIDGRRIDYPIPSEKKEILEADGLSLFPALIDPHVHFRTPGGEHKENWITGSRAAIAGGVTTVFDMPNNSPACTSLARLQEKKGVIEEQLAIAGIPLRYHLYLGAHKEEIPEIQKAHGAFIAIKVFMGQSTGNLLMDSDEAFEMVCQEAAKIQAIVAIHAEDEATLQKNSNALPQEKRTVEDHSRLRSREAAIVALQKAINVARKYGTRLYVLHTSTSEEVNLIRKAKLDGMDIAAEVTPHHLFLTEADYDRLGTLAQMNPPIRTQADCDALWKGIKDGTIDTVGTDHAPHTLDEKKKPYGQAPSGVPGIETLLPLLVTAAEEGKISLEDIVRVTRTNAQRFFHLDNNDDVVLVDTHTKKEVRNELLKTKCGWSPFAGTVLTGCPQYTILKGNIYKVHS